MAHRHLAHHRLGDLLAIFIGTLLKRREPHIYVANWFYLAFILTIAVLHIVNNLTVPVSVFGSKSYSVFSGVQDALIQWWYGHNAVGFFLTAGFLGDDVLFHSRSRRTGRSTPTGCRSCISGR